jgi:exodeoxyribonuclease VII small subunit
VHASNAVERMAENKSPSFESSLDRLKAVVDELERESVDLERSVELFKEGRTLVARCEGLLKNAEETLRTADGTAAAPSTAERVDDDERPDDEPPF